MSIDRHVPDRCPLCRGRKRRDEVSPRLLRLHDEAEGGSVGSRFSGDMLAKLRARTEGKAS